MQLRQRLRVVDMGEPGPRADFANPALRIAGLGSLPLTARQNLLLDRQAAALSFLTVLAQICRACSPASLARLL